jgi:hypothetical protein
MTKEEFLQYLEENSVRDPESIHYVQQSPLSLPFDNLKFVGKGLFNTVYKATIGADSWIIKEGAYDLRLPLTKSIYLPLPRKVFDRIYKLFGVSLMPSHKSAIEQLQEYVLLARYFGYFAEDSKAKISGFDPEIKSIQREIRDSLRQSIVEEDDFAEGILSSVKTFKNYHKIKELVLEDDLMYYDFLPNEHLILSLMSERKGALKLFSRKVENHYIIQDCAPGDTLGTIEDESLFENRKTLQRLIIFILIATAMSRYENKLIDSRPEGVLNGDWFGATGNIVIQLEEGEVKFVDTRWLNKQDGNLIQKGIVISDLIRDALSRNLSKYVEAL